MPSKHSKPLVQPKSTSISKKTKRPDDEHRPSSKKLKREVKELEKDHEESMFYQNQTKDKKSSPPVMAKTSKKEEQSPRRGNAFSDAEICYMLGLLYAGLDNSECTRSSVPRYRDIVSCIKYRYRSRKIVQISVSADNIVAINYLFVQWSAWSLNQSGKGGNNQSLKGRQSFFFFVPTNEPLVHTR